MAPSSPSTDAATLLIDQTHTLTTLLSQFSITLSSPPQSSPSPLNISDPPNPLSLLTTTATLLRAHTTKVSLLLLNPPFTPSALHRELREIGGSVLPAMMSAVQICDAERGTKYPDVLCEEVRSRVGDCVREVQTVVSRVRSLAEEFRNEGKSLGGKGDEREVKKVTERLDGLGLGGGDAGEAGRDVLASTGVGWEACDKLVGLGKAGLVGVVVKRVQEWRDLVKDAVEELKEWGEEDEEQDEEDEVDEVEEDKDSLAEIFGADKLPKGHEGLRVQLEAALKKLKLVGTLYQAIVKRRLLTLPPILDDRPEVTPRLDDLIAKLKEIPGAVDDLAGAFYELDEKQAQRKLDVCCGTAQEAVALISKNWQGIEDPFTEWSKKWTDALQAMGK
ncbi:MAG: hypothetical protein M1820_005830 [Bogoriella megaspora]|nr:MAG: hypothetical protein M1820_005830 [Bogoriella megaspora]